MGRLFKGAVSAEKVFDTITSGVDKLAFTQEERSDMNKLLADRIADFAKETLEENSIRSIARRYVAIAVTSVFLFLTLLYVAMQMAGQAVGEIKELLFDSPLSTAFIMVLAFFFGGYYAKSFSLLKKK